MDEPCSGLLADEIDEIDAVIRRIVEERGCAVVVVEHRLELLFAIAEARGRARRRQRDRSRPRERGLRAPDRAQGLLRGRRERRVSTALSVRGLSAGYGPLQVLDGIDLDVGRARARRPRRPQRARQEHAHARDRRPRRLAHGRDRVERPRPDEDADAPAGARGHRPDPAGRLAVPGPVGARQPRRRRVRARQLAQARREPRARRGDLPAPRRAHEAGRRHALGRRAAHVLDRARPHGARRTSTSSTSRRSASRRASPRRSCARSAVSISAAAHSCWPSRTARSWRAASTASSASTPARSPASSPAHRRRSPRDRRPHHHDLPGRRLLARRARPLAHLGRPRLPQPGPRRDLLGRRGRRLRGLDAHQRQYAVVRARRASSAARSSAS